MKILYITYIDFAEDAKSGSSVRPKKIYEAFLDEGHEIILLQTQQNKREERKKAVKTIFNKLEKENIDVCYIESPSGPIFNNIDIKLIKKVNEKGIPISFFYRDAYWLFAKDWVKSNKIKDFVIEKLQKRDLKVFQKNVKYFYMPSEMSCDELLKYYSFHSIKELPPGTDETQIQEFNITHTAIYVGGCSYQYGVDFLIDVYQSLHEKGYDYKLIIVTRKTEWEKMYPKGTDYDWLEVYHISGKDLTSIYRKADCAFLPQRKNFYVDLSYGIKLFEYLSYGKPIISNDLKTMGRFVNKYNCGLVYDGTKESMAKAIISFYDNNQLAEKLYKNVVRACKENTWAQRVRTIVADFNK